MENEIWKDIVGFEGYYQVSSLGRIKSLFRKINSDRWDNRFQKESIMKLSNDKNGYDFVHLRKNGKYKNMFIHRLVALAFIENLENKSSVNHKNGVKKDNCVDNLEWVTNSENAIHAVKLGLIKQGVDNVTSKPVLDTQVGVFYYSAKDASNCLGIAYSSLRSMLNGGRKNITNLVYV